jgi:hypothetical protein
MSLKEYTEFKKAVKADNPALSSKQIDALAKAMWAEKNNVNTSFDESEDSIDEEPPEDIIIAPKPKIKAPPADMSLIEAMVQQAVAKIMAENKGTSADDVLKKLDKLVNKKEDEGNVLDLDDLLDEPIFFFSYGSSITLFDDRRRGQRVPPPFGAPVRFTPSYRTKQVSVSQKDVKIVHVCGVKVTSRKVAEWLRAHTLFNIRFFEQIGAARAIDSYLADKMTEAANSLTSLTPIDIINRAKLLGVPISKDIDEMRRGIIMKIAEREIKVENDRAATFAMSADREMKKIKEGVQ